MSSITTSFCQALGLSLPIVQAPMAGSQASAMAIAVGRAGGLGSLPSATLSVEALERELQALDQAQLSAYNVNFFVHQPPQPDPIRETRWRETLAPYYEEHGIANAEIAAGPARAPFTHAAADVVERFKPRVVSFHFGLPDDTLMARVRSWGSQIWSSATTLDEALWLEAKGVDAIIAQGLEAGGHRGVFLGFDGDRPDLSQQLNSMALITQIVAAVKVPVIAAGGIANAQGVQAALALGACAVQVGTAYLLCDEATTSAVHRAALRSEQANRTALTNLFTGRPARGIVNRLMLELGALNSAAPAFPLAASALAPLKAIAEAQGRGDFSSLWAGQDVSGCQAISAALLTQQLGAGMTHSTRVLGNKKW
jgi:nitronate monooxygenase